MPHEKLPIIDPQRDMDLFERPPGWMRYWGGAMVLGLLAVLLAIAAWVSYPVRIEIPVRIRTTTPPVAIVVPADGIIQTLWVTDGTPVVAGAPLLMLDNPAKYDDVQRLDSLLTQWEQWMTPADVQRATLPKDLRIGILDRDYTAWVNHVGTLRYRMERQGNGQRAEQRRIQRRHLEAVRTSLLQQMRHQREEVAIAERNAQQFQELLERQTASQLEVDAADIRLLRTRQELQALESRLSENEGRLAALADSGLAVADAQSDEVMVAWLAVQQYIRLLRLGVREWEQRYLLRARTAGSVSWPAPLQVGQSLAAQTVAMSIVSEVDTIAYMAEGSLPGAAYGELHVGDTAYIRLDAFPHRVYGQLPARLAHIASVPTGEVGSYRIVLSLPQGLTTRYGRRVPFRQDMPGQATLLGVDRSILQRLLARMGT